jgi:hypothetical protein
MVKIDTKAFKKAWYSFEEIQQVIKSEEKFEKTWITHSFNDVKKNVRTKLFTKTKVNV